MCNLIRSDNALLGRIALVLYAQVIWEAAVAVEAPLLVGQQSHRLVELYLRVQNRTVDSVKSSQFSTVQLSSVQFKSDHFSLV